MGTSTIDNLQPRIYVACFARSRKGSLRASPSFPLAAPVVV